MARLLPARRAAASSPGCASGRGDVRRAGQLSARGRAAGAERSRPRGTASGIAAATTTTARRWARPTNDECRIDSIAQSWAVLSRRRAAAVRRARHRRGAHPPGVARHAHRRAADAAVRQARRRNLATSRATRPACARTAASTRTPPRGSSWRSRELDSGDEAMELFHMINPINHARTRADVERYKIEPYVVAGDVYTNPAHAGPRRLVVVHRLGRLAVSRRTREPARPAAARATRSPSIRACRPSWPGYEIQWHCGQHPLRRSR